MPVTEEEIQRRINALCDAETNEEERAAYESDIRIGAGLQDAHEIAVALRDKLKQVAHDAWNTPAHVMLLRLYVDARDMAGEINGWDETEDGDGGSTGTTGADGRGGPSADATRPVRHGRARSQSR